MKKRGEAEFVTKLQKWLKHNWPHSGPIEVKYSYEKSFNYKFGFKPHQLDNLINASDGRYCVTYKISDMDRMAKPYDLVCFRAAVGMVAIQWDRPRNNIFYIINPRAIMDAIEGGEKSLTEDRAAEMAHVIGELKS